MYFCMFSRVQQFLLATRVSNIPLCTNAIPRLIIHMKKLLDSDWLRVVQIKCNTSTKSVTPVQITHRNSQYYDLQKNNEKFCRPIIPCKAMTKTLYRNSEKRFSRMRKKWLQETFSGHFFRANFFMFVLLISNRS